jgi:hypothetical protein|uniref:Uncharacterized protein n=2 Tax=Picea TaxID=3328 RepID=A0A101M591_PICGL|nr:hypothetical protein ABT39_MTgene1173 [Picea glauca]QHR91733.1 hypothetical protein Q903MT_gene5769 [Picea sitchensis]
MFRLDPLFVDHCSFIPFVHGPLVDKTRFSFAMVWFTHEVQLRDGMVHDQLVQLKQLVLDHFLLDNW